MPTYTVTMPITGRAVVTVEAENEEAAKEEALGIVTLGDIEEWEALEEVNRGNVCYAMHPWNIMVEEG